MQDAWNSTAGRKVRARCFDRDRRRGARCIWCGGAIDYNPELALDPANIAAAHFHCNAARGSRAGLTNLGRPSREW